MHPHRLVHAQGGLYLYGEGGMLPAFADDMQPPLPFAFARFGGA